GALIEASVLDERGAPLPGATVRSAPRQSPDAWTPVAVTLRGPFPGARTLRIDLLLLQPDQFPVSRVAEQFVPRPEDLSGAAYFDDVAVIQLPRVRLSSPAPGNVFVGGNRPRLTAQVRDLTGEDLHAEIVTRDLTDAVVDRQDVALGRGGALQTIEPRLPRYGWYSVEMNLTRVSNVSAQAGQLARTTVLWLGEPWRSGEADRAAGLTGPFTLIGETVGPRQFLAAAALATLTGASRFTLPAMLDDLPPGVSRPPLEGVLNTSAGGAAELTAVLASLPVSLADRLRVEPTDVISLGTISQNEWLGVMMDKLGTVGPRIGSWQIGSVRSGGAADDAKVLAMLTGLRSGIHRFSPNPRIVLPWRADEQWPAWGRPGGGSGSKSRPLNAVTMLYPVSFSQSEVERTVAGLQPLRDEGLDLTLVPESVPPEQFGYVAETNEWAQRTVLLWAATQPSPGAVAGGQPRPRVGLLDPWDTASGDGGLNPRPSLAALAMLNEAVKGRRVGGEVPSAAHVHGLILAPEEGGPAIGSLSIGSGALLAWTDAGDDAADSIAGYFGGGTLTLIDMFGNRTPLAAEPGTGRHVIPVTGSPVIVEGIDAHLVKFIAEVKITPAFIPAVVATHDCEVVLRNPWSTRITGDIQLIPPEAGSRAQRDWSFAPSTPIAFSIAPGQTARLPFSFIFSSIEEAGPKPVQLLVRLSADRPYPAMRIGKSINVGLEDLELSVTAALGPREDGPNVIVTTTVTNSGRLTRTLQLSSHAVGFATQSQPIVDLTPGEAAVRRFILPNGAEALAGRKIRVLLVDVDGAERLNKYAVVPN
ncbi:MAG: hypothetical protein K2Q09_03125, partial [Phycisphaerales bacterium]|nr:hypothetical protein [Phycisphaerales bacterium]